MNRIPVKQLEFEASVSKVKDGRASELVAFLSSRSVLGEARR